MTVEVSQRSMAGSEVCGRDRKYYSLPDAARALGLSVKILRRAALNGYFPTYTPEGTRRRVRLEDIQAWIQSTRSQPASEKASVHADGVVTERLQRETRKRRASVHEQPDSRELRDQGNARPIPEARSPKTATDSDLTETLGEK